MHDRLVEVTDLINNNSPIQETLKKRLLMNASRLEKYDPKITKSINDLIETWNKGFNYKSEDASKSTGELQVRKDGCLKMVDNIKSRVDKLVK